MFSEEGSMENVSPVPVANNGSLHSELEYVATCALGSCNTVRTLKGDKMMLSVFVTAGDLERREQTVRVKNEIS